MKTKGILRDDGLKDFELTHDGNKYLAVRQPGNKWMVDTQLFPSLKAAKEAVMQGSIFDSPPATEAKGLWDCVDPCALVVLYAPHDNPTVRQTLDAHGWIEAGKVDVGRAKRLLNLVRSC